MDVYQRRRLVALSALAGIFIIFVLLIRSCGGDDEEAPIEPIAGATGLGGATALTVEDYLAQADAICLESNNSLAEVDATDAAGAASEQSEIVTSELQQLQTLPVPEDGGDDIQAFLDLFEELAVLYDDLATAAERDPEAVVEIETSLDETSADVLDAAEVAGFQVCGDPSQVGETDTGGGGGGGGGDETTEDTTDAGGTAPSDTAVVPETPPTDTVTPPPADTGDTGTVTPPTDTPPATGGTGDGSSSGGVSP
jgi:hypothetical protein